MIDDDEARPPHPEYLRLVEYIEGCLRDEGYTREGAVFMAPIVAVVTAAKIIGLLR